MTTAPEPETEVAEVVTEQSIIVTATFNLYGSTKASDLAWWAGRLPASAAVYADSNGERLTAQWRL